jgi:hypothetical protein
VAAATPNTIAAAHGITRDDQPDRGGVAGGEVTVDREVAVDEVSVAVEAGEVSGHLVEACGAAARLRQSPQLGLRESPAPEALRASERAGGHRLALRRLRNSSRLAEAGGDALHGVLEALDARVAVALVHGERVVEKRPERCELVA